MRRADVCVVQIAECFRDDADILCNPIGISPIIGGRLAKATFANEVVMTDAVSVLAANIIPLGDETAERVVESYVPYRTIFDIVWSGRRHVMMGATQIDQFGNQNIAAIGGYEQPKAQLLGLRGAPGNLINHRTSYWIPKHSTRSFVKGVDVVSGPGYDKMRSLGAPSNKYHDVHRVVSNLGVFDFLTPDNRMRIVSVHPGVSVEEIREHTEFEIEIPEILEESRFPTEIEIDLIKSIDPDGLRYSEVDDE
ncbi:MAG: CoA-transferase [Acidimicrobiaceae bacterium]|jgi:acyl CoA:acetate/3-ketoacid CoA transferase beta subunit|nr:CoA-transferase [Acidimicrobiaceae bacterium]|tara:strand:+ start:22737 stop:23489 length:753 start_codon:yes stop_codon:yes gene_type:complete